MFREKFKIPIFFLYHSYIVLQKEFKENIRDGIIIIVYSDEFWCRFSPQATIVALK